jgi:hypothetical protein
VDVTVQQAHGVPLAWLEIMHVAATEQCRVLDLARALSITVCGRAKLWTKSRLPVCAGGTLIRPMVDRT